MATNKNFKKPGYPVDKLGESDATQTPQTPLTSQPVKQ